IKNPPSTRRPACVRMTALIACANPAPKKRTASSSAPATTLHFTHADKAIASSDRNAIQINDESNMLHAIQKCSAVHVDPARLACTVNKINPGTHVICESKIANTEALPTTYSARENGRQKYNGNAPLARSGEIKPGPLKAVSTKASVPCTVIKVRKNPASILKKLPISPNFARKLRLCER